MKEHEGAGGEGEGWGERELEASIVTVWQARGLPHTTILTPLKCWMHQLKDLWPEINLQTVETLFAALTSHASFSRVLGMGP